MLHIRPQRTLGAQEEEEEERRRRESWTSATFGNDLSSAQEVMMMGETKKCEGEVAAGGASRCQ